jgi:hypothetical protein
MTTAAMIKGIRNADSLDELLAAFKVISYWMKAIGGQYMAIVV